MGIIGRSINATGLRAEADYSLRQLPAISAFIDDCTLFYTYHWQDSRRAAEDISQQLWMIQEWDSLWLATLAQEKTQARMAHDVNSHFRLSGWRKDYFLLMLLSYSRNLFRFCELRWTEHCTWCLFPDTLPIQSPHWGGWFPILTKKECSCSIRSRHTHH